MGDCIGIFSGTNNFNVSLYMPVYIHRSVDLVLSAVDVMLLLLSLTDDGDRIGHGDRDAISVTVIFVFRSSRKLLNVK